MISTAAHANLVVSVGVPKTVGQKTVIKLELQNTFPEKVESARAAMFLPDEKGKIVGQSTKWVIGGSKANTGLQSGKETTFSFVIGVSKPITTTNLTSKITFSQIVLEGGKQADPAKEVVISSGK